MIAIAELAPRDSEQTAYPIQRKAHKTGTPTGEKRRVTPSPGASSTAAMTQQAKEAK